jgi:hypothetical protein
LFAIGEAESVVYYTKLRLPKEYNLRRKDRKIYGTWMGEWVLYLSDEITPLRAKSGKDGNIFEVNLDLESRMDVPRYLEDKRARIRGCISTIEIEFINKMEVKY